MFPILLAAQITAAAHGTAPQPLDPATWLTPADYGKLVATVRDPDPTRYLVSVDAEGKPFRCRITESSGVVRLDQVACAAVMVRGHFRPALDEGGAPVASLYPGLQRWPGRGAAPEDAAAPEADLILNVDRLPGGATALAVDIRQIVRADGTTESCVIDRFSGVAALDRIACASAAPLIPPGPITDAKGAGLRAMRLTRLSFTTAMPEPTMWITVDDYPKEAIHRGEEGRTVMHWDISETGMVENCKIVATSGSKLLDSTACDLMTRRGRFTPAKDAAGKPIRSDATRSIRWKLPPRPDFRVDDTLQEKLHAQDMQQQAIDRGSLGTPQ